MEELIRDFSGKIIGRYIHKPNGDIEVKDFYGKILGYYKKSLNITTDFYGKILAKGNAVGMLLRG